jgi:hypothetical protein
MAAPVEVMHRALSAARAGGVRSAEGEPAGDDPLAVAGAGGAAGPSSDAGPTGA